MSANSFIPALRFHALTPYYDRLNRLAARESLVHKIIFDEIQLCNQDKLLDLGCGTGSLIESLKKLNPDFEAIGVDVDPKILAIAKKRGTLKGDGKTSFVESTASSLPFASGYFDQVVSTLMFHHLRPEEKRQSLSEIYRVLKPSGKFILVDWGKPDNAIMRLAFVTVQILDGLETTQENLDGKLETLVRDSGFSETEIIKRISSLVGTIEFIKATK